MEFVPNWGATIVGARKFLIAYNINTLSTKEQAHRIALDIREQGRGSSQVFISALLISACMVWWLSAVSGKFGALRPKGRRFEFHFSPQVGTLDKSFSHSCL